ncbi:hypothetical protein [Granulicoccus phenolivorans]|uniref:hypothetical protein n=1 Tax=Granulicoccus phenolivorans TaxID=266854 RepID=UPI00047DD809|nr:hypothetical protein [Granulicoccus phenolivorans]
MNRSVALQRRATQPADPAGPAPTVESFRGPRGALPPGVAPVRVAVPVIGAGLAALALLTTVVAYLRSGTASIDTTGDVLTTVGVLLGLLSVAAAAVLILLAVGIPAVDDLLGADRAAAGRRLLILWLPVALIAEALLVAGGYALGDNPGALHDYALLLGDPWFRAGWLTLGILAAATALGFGLVGPLVANLTHRLRVHAVAPGEPGDPGAITVWLSGRRVEDLLAGGSRYLHVRLLTPTRWRQQSRYALARAAGRLDAEHGLLEVTLRPARRTAGKPPAPVRPGTRVWFTGPYALVTNPARTARDVVLVGIGHGTAVVRTLLETLDFAPGHATVVIRATSADRAYLLPEIQQLCRRRGAGLYVLLGHRGRFGDGSPSWLPLGKHAFRLRNFAPNLIDSDLYVCGPADVTRLVLADARADGVDRRRLHWSPDLG